MLGGWWLGQSPSSPDSNFLRVVNAFPNRRLSDNTLMTPKIRIAPSCASSPGIFLTKAHLNSYNIALLNTRLKVAPLVVVYQLDVTRVSVPRNDEALP